MLELTLKEAKVMKKEIEKFIKETGNKIMTQRIYGFLNDLGLELTNLGTGQSSYTSSGRIEIKEINSKEYLNGKFLVIGIANKGSKKGIYYRGYVAEIKEEK